MINEVRFEIILQNIVYILNVELKGLAYNNNEKKFYVYHTGTISDEIKDLCSQLVRKLFDENYSVVFQSIL